MSTRARAILFFIFLFGFLIAAPLVVLYTAGFRYNVTSGRFTQTGVLSLGSTPKGATIYIDDERRRERTPAVLQNILPGTHRVRLEKDGYTAWEKTLSVAARQTTFATKVALFLNREAASVVEADATAFAIEKDDQLAAYTKTEGSWTELWAFDGDDGSFELLSRIPDASDARPQVRVAWSSGGDYVSLSVATDGASQDWSLIRTDDGTRLTLNDLVPEATSGVWDAEREGRFWASTPTGLTSIDLPRMQMDTIPEASAAVTTGWDTVFVQNNGERTIVARKAGDLSEPIAYLPLGTYTFHAAPDGLLLLADAGRRHLYLLDAHSSSQPILLSAQAIHWQWHPDNARLLYSDGFDLHVYDVTMHTDETLTRVSNEILDLAWYPTADAVLFAQTGTLSAIELDQRDGRQTTTLLEASDLRGLWVDPSGRNAYVFATVDGVAGLWRRQLQR